MLHSRNTQCSNGTEICCSTPIVEAYLLFCQAVMPTFTTLNKFLQRETPCVHLVDDMLESFIKKIFIKISQCEI